MDRDVVNLIHHLRWDVTVDWNQARDWLFCPDDTPVDAQDFLVGSNNQIPQQLRDFVSQVDQQMAGLPKEDFMFGYPITSERPRKKGTARPCFVAMPYGPKWFNDVEATIRSAGTARSFDCKVSQHGDGGKDRRSNMGTVAASGGGRGRSNRQQPERLL